MEQRIEGGQCPNCGGTNVKSPKTGKIFCGNKCWLNQAQNNATQAPYSPPTPQLGNTAQNTTKEQIERKTDWDKISWGKCKHAYLIEMLKDSLNKGKPINLDKAEEGAELWADMSMRKVNQTLKEKITDHPSMGANIREEENIPDDVEF